MNANLNRSDIRVRAEIGQKLTDYFEGGTGIAPTRPLPGLTGKPLGSGRDNDIGALECLGMGLFWLGIFACVFIWLAICGVIEGLWRRMR